MYRVVSQLLIIPTSAQPSEKIYFKNEPLVNDNILIGLQIPQSRVDLGVPPDPPTITDGKGQYENVLIGDFSNFATDNLNTFFLTLCDKAGNEVHKNLCLYTFYAAGNNGQIRKFFYNDIDLKKSYVQCAGVPYLPPVPANDYGVIFDFIVKIK
jgi:hypothetical protein